jgi:hypothetical protein
MSPRFAPVIAASVLIVLVAACGASGAPTPSPVFSPATPPGPTIRPLPTIAPETPPTATPDAGNVDGGLTGPELTIETVNAETIRATIADRKAKAWRLVVAGVGERSGDRWEILVETGDVRPSITATEIRGGTVVDVMDLSAFADGTAAAGGCHRTLPVCLDSDGFRLPQDGDGTFSVRLVLPERGTPLTVTGGTASWPGEPFVLGPWTDTAPFPWNAAG